MNISLLITTFNSPGALDLVLRSVVSQSRAPDSVVICDDGSSFETGNIVRQWMSRLPIRYVWQPDKSFRAARVRNLGASKTDAEYLIWIDGDCLIPKNFVEKHVKLGECGYLVAGGRCLLPALDTRCLLVEKESLDRAFTYWKFWFFPLGFLRKKRPTAWEAVRSCNMAIYRNDLVLIDGFDESYSGWGREDSDFVVRLLRLGIKVKSARFAACVAHLYHAERSRDQLSVNDERFRKCLDDRSHICAKLSIFSQA